MESQLAVQPGLQVHAAVCGSAPQIARPTTSGAGTVHCVTMRTNHSQLTLACLLVILPAWGQGRLAAEADAHTRNLDDLQRFLQQVCSQAGAAPTDGAEPQRSHSAAS